MDRTTLDGVAMPNVDSPVESSSAATQRAGARTTETRSDEARPRRLRGVGRPSSPRPPATPAGEATVKRDSRETDAHAALVDTLWKEYHAAPGDDTRNALVEAYQGFASEVTRRFAVRLPRSVDRGDLVTAGNVGLMNAIGGFDPERGVRFESYCELRVKGALLDELRTQDWLPRPWRQRIEQQKRAIEALRAREVREPNDEEVALEMGLNMDLYQQLFGVGLPGVPSGSMAADGTDGDVTPALDIVPDPGAVDPDEGLTREELHSLVTQRLSEQEYRILFLRYWEGLAMREIGELTGLSESRVCKVHTRLLERLHERLRVSHGEE